MLLTIFVTPNFPAMPVRQNTVHNSRKFPICASKTTHISHFPQNFPVMPVRQHKVHNSHQISQLCQ